MVGELDPNASLFGNDEEVDPQKEHFDLTFGKNGQRTSALTDLMGKNLLEAVNAEADIPEEGKQMLILKMATNSILDIVMESLDPATREEVASYLDAYIGMCLVNLRFNVDLLKELSKALNAMKIEEGESEEDFERRVLGFEDAWWDLPQPVLDGRTPDDAIRREAKRYGLD